MSSAYVDTSAALAIAFIEPRWETTAERLESYTRLVSSNLLEAEMRARYAREGLTFVAADVVSKIEWVFPDRSLGPEFERTLRAGYLRGADLFHVATALYISSGEPSDLVFLTLDVQQRNVAASLGFRT